jgi:hypothetical protein
VYGSPLAGLVVGLHVKPGDRVQLNDLLLVLDAMKMEINTQSAGIIKSIEVSPNDAVSLIKFRSTWNRRADPPDWIADPQNFFPNLLLP